MRYPGEFKVCPRDATETTEVDAEAEVDEMIGQTLASSYTIVRAIGERGMGAGARRGTRASPPSASP